MKKKTLAVLLSLCVAFSLVACSSDEKGAQTPKEPDSSNDSEIEVQRDPAEDPNDEGDEQDEKPFEPVPRGRKCNTVAVCDHYAVCVNNEGKLVSSAISIGDEEGRTNVTAVESGASGKIFELLSDGSVICLNTGEQVAAWDGMEIVELAEYFNLCYALRSDGAVLDESGNILIENEDIVSIAATAQCVFGVKSDGTLAIYHPNGWTLEQQYAAVEDNWTDLVQVEAGNHLVAGLKSDGTVVLLYDEEEFAEDQHSWDGPTLDTVSEWTDINSIDIAESDSVKFDIVGVKSDGTVVTAGNFRARVFNETQEWTNIVGVRIDKYYITGVTADGAIIQLGASRESDDDPHATQLDCDDVMLPW